MRKGLLGMIALAVYAAASASQPCGAADVPPPSITVQGSGEARAETDLAILGFGVETAAAEAGTAISDNAARSTAVAAALKKELDERATVSTTQYRLDPVYDHRRDRDPGEPPTITGYVARNEVRVETKQLDAIGKLIDAATSAGANRVNGLSFALSEEGEPRRRALASATRNARERAAVIAQSLGVKLGAVLQATTSGHGPSPLRSFQAGAMAMEARQATPIDPGDIRIHETVHVTFAVE